MSQVAIERVGDAGKKTLPVFDEIAKRIKAIQRRAFDLFEKRGHGFGHDLEDWLKAEHELMSWPAAELAEKDDAYKMEVALPGFEAKDIEVTVTPYEIIVHGATKKQKQSEKESVLWTEFGSNDVYRSFGLPNPISVDKVTANLENGILRVNAPEIPKPKEVATAA